MGEGIEWPAVQTLRRLRSRQLARHNDAVRTSTGAKVAKVPRNLQFHQPSLYPHCRLQQTVEAMGDYQIGGGLKLLTAVEKTEAFAEFLKTRMVRALETEDPTELHYLLAQLDDYHSYLWRYYRKLAQERAQRMDPGV